MCLSWHLSLHNFVSNKCGDSVSCYRSCLYLSPHQLLTLSLFSPSSPSEFPNTSSRISPTFNTLSFSLLDMKKYLSSHYLVPITYTFTNHSSMCLQTKILKRLLLLTMQLLIQIILYQTKSYFFLWYY